jgi:dihydroneopterin aldolase
MAHVGKIVVSGIEVFAYHGVTPLEKERGQRFLIDIELEYDCSRAVAADELDDAVDYDTLAGEVSELAIRERYGLIETLAARIGEHVMNSTPALSALVRVHKPEAPMRCEVGLVSVEMAFKADGQ